MSFGFLKYHSKTCTFSLSHKGMVCSCLHSAIIKLHDQLEFLWQLITKYHSRAWKSKMRSAQELTPEKMHASRSYYQSHHFRWLWKTSPILPNLHHLMFYTNYFDPLYNSLREFRHHFNLNYGAELFCPHKQYGACDWLRPQEPIVNFVANEIRY